MRRQNSSANQICLFLFWLTFNMNNKEFPYVVRLAAILVSLFIIVTVLYYLKIVLVPLLFSVIFAVMLFPFGIRFEKWGFSKGLASFITVLIATVFLVFLAYLILRQVGVFLQQTPQLTDKSNKIIDNIQQFATQKFGFKKAVLAHA